MKFTVVREEFIDMLSVVSRVTASKSPNLVLEGIKFSVTGKTITMEATDLEQAITATISPIDVEGEGDFIVLPSRIMQVLRELNDAEVTLITDEVNLILQGAVGTFRYRRMGTDDFPVLPKFPETGYFELDAVPFRTMLDRTVFCSAREKGRYAINGVYLCFEDNLLEIAATDGRRLAICRYEFPDAKAVKSDIILPTKIAEIAQKEMERLQDGEKLQFATDGKQASFKIGDIVLSGRLVEGEYPNYRGVVPASLDKVAMIQRDEMLRLAKMATVFTDSLNKNVIFTYSDGKLTLKSVLPELGDSEISMPIDYSGEEVRMGFNPFYLLDYFKAVAPEIVKLSFSSSKKAVLLEVPDDEYNYKYVLMPMVVKEDMND